MVEEKSELRSGITAPFNKRLNEALQFNPQMPFNIGNTVIPSQLIGVLKGEQGTPGLPAAISAVKDSNNLIMLVTTPIERGILKLNQSSSTLSNAGGETLNLNFTVPQNKKWVLKGVATTVGTFVGTFSSSTLYLLDNAISQPLATSATPTLTFNPTITYTLEPGMSVRIRLITTAWTSGQLAIYLAYQEFEI